MAKVAELCMLCENNPCTCFKKERPKRAPKPRAAPKVEDVELATEPAPKKSNALAAMKARAKKAESPASPQPIESPPEVEVPADISPELASALRALEPIMHPDEKAKYKTLLESEPSLEEKRVTWNNIREYRKEVERGAEQ